MEAKDMFEIKKEAYRVVAESLFIAADYAEAKAACIYYECTCGETEHTEHAKYCCGCGMELKGAAANGSQ